MYHDAQTAAHDWGNVSDGRLDAVMAYIVMAHTTGATSLTAGSM